MTHLIHIQMPFWQLALAILVPPVLAGGLFVGLRRLLLRRTAPEEERDWSVPALVPGDGTSLFHQWDVRCKIVAILGYAFMVAALTRFSWAMVAVGGSAAMAFLARVSLARVAVRLLAIAGFVGMFLVVMPLTVPGREGDSIVVINGVDWLGINLRGVWLAATIAAKAVAITLLMEPLMATAPLPVTLYGLHRLGAPDMIGQMVLLSHRYVHVFRHEARRMASGMQVRGFRRRTNLITLRAVANFLGMLFVRSFDRTERVFDAMRARGYTGRFPQPAELKLRAMDLVKSVGVVLIGIALIVGDRMGG